MLTGDKVYDNTRVNVSELKIRNFYYSNPTYDSCL